MDARKMTLSSPGTGQKSLLPGFYPGAFRCNDHEITGKPATTRFLWQSPGGIILIKTYLCGKLLII
jgi:hypothetical protein